MTYLELRFLHNRKHQSEKVEYVVNNGQFKKLRAGEGFNLLGNWSFITSWLGSIRKNFNLPSILSSAEDQTLMMKYTATLF